MDSRGIVWNIKSEGSLASNGNRATMSMNGGDAGIYTTTNSSRFIYRIRLKMFEKGSSKQGRSACVWMKSASERQRRTGGLNHVRAEKGAGGYENSRPGPLWGSWRWKARVVARNRWLAAQHRHKFEQNFARNAEIVANPLSSPREFVKLTRGLLIFNVIEQPLWTHSR